MSLQSMLGRNTWPPADVLRDWERMELFAALRDNDDTRLRQEASWPYVRPIVWSPVARMVSRASAHLLFGEEPKITPAAESDGDNVQRIVDGNDLPSELHRAAVIASSEGAVWGRIMVDPAVCDVPIIMFESARCVIPHFRGRFVVGATFVQEYPVSSSEVYRLFVTYTAGAVSSSMYRGSGTKLGGEVALSAHPSGEGMSPVVLTGIDRPLVAFIPNSIDSDPTCGVSDYHGLEARFLGISESSTVALENMRLAGKMRSFVDGRYLRNGALPAGEDVFVRVVDDVIPGQSDTPLQMLQYTFAGDQLTAYVEHLIDTTLQFSGIAPELVGRNAAGGALSGTALRMRMIHSLLENSGKGRFFDTGIARLMRFAALVDSMRIADGGFGRKWADALTVPDVERGDGLPQDDTEAAQQVATLAAAEAISTEAKVRWMHPEWSDDLVGAEVEAIDAMRTAASVTTPPFTPNPLPSVGDPASLLNVPAAGAALGAP